jgi:DNA end-binding protein Ku
MPKRAKTDTIEFKPKKKAPLPAATLGKPYWSGAISFGLVNVPIRLFPAVHEKTVRFHLLHSKDEVRLHQKLICPVDNQEVSREETLRGYEIEKNKNVVLDPEELKALQPKAEKVLELISFVELSQIDPIYFDRPFYVMPAEAGVKGYHLLVEALSQTKRAGIGKIIMKTKEYLAALRPVGNILCLETMHFRDEVVVADELVNDIPKAKASDAEIKVATQLVESLAAPFKPEQLHDDYREALLKLIDQKARGGHIKVTPTDDDQEPEVIDLMTALQKSLTAAKKAKGVKAA